MRHTQTPGNTTAPTHRAEDEASNTQHHGDTKVERTSYSVVKAGMNMFQDSSAEQSAHCIFVGRTVLSDHQLHDHVELEGDRNHM